MFLYALLFLSQMFSTTGDVTTSTSTQPPTPSSITATTGLLTYLDGKLCPLFFKAFTLLIYTFSAAPQKLYCYACRPLIDPDTYGTSWTYQQLDSTKCPDGR